MMPEGTMNGKPQGDDRAGLPALETTRIALELSRLLSEKGLTLAARPSLSPWVSLEEAATMFDYSVSRFYHVYAGLGLVPSRASRRKLRFNRAEIEKTLRDRQKSAPGRPKRSVTREWK
jgi:hypothetical protein